jgi:exosome complex component RRP45
MPREVQPSTNAQQFFAKALNQNIRLDGRGPDQFRPLEIEFGEEYGTVDVRLGKTRYFLTEHSYPTTPHLLYLLDFTHLIPYTSSCKHLQTG